MEPLNTIEGRIIERLGLLKTPFGEDVRRELRKLVKEDIMRLYHLGKSPNSFFKAEQYTRMYHNYTDEQIEFA